MNRLEDRRDGGWLACDLAAGLVPLPGGRIYETAHWLVEHCVGPLGPGTLIVKPRRHVTSVGEMSDGEATEIGPLLRRASAVAGELVDAEQVYNCLWSHAGGHPAHLHYVIQPVTAEQMARYGSQGPTLQTAMFADGVTVPDDQIVALARRARAAFAHRGSAALPVREDE